MKSNEFTYWLQGYFELREDDGALSLSQIKCIKRHIELVQKVEGLEAGLFIFWLTGVLDAINCLETDLDELGITDLIKGKLGEYFKHEIDDSYGEGLPKIDKDKLLEKLDEIHNKKIDVGGTHNKIDPWKHPTVYRC